MSQDQRSAVYYLTTQVGGGDGGGPTEDPRQATYEASPYNWVFFTYGQGLGAYRFQEGGRVEVVGMTSGDLLDRIDEYEAQLATHNYPVSHEWGQIYGSTSSQRRRLLDVG
jgi:hypothetical protein